MICFLKTLSGTFGQLLSTQSYYLARPEHLLTPSDISRAVGTVIKHPILESYAWQFSDAPIMIHPDAQADTLDPVLTILHDYGAITSQDIVETHQKIEAFRGTYRTVLEVMPASLNKLKTYEEMLAEGWFELPPE